MTSSDPPNASPTGPVGGAEPAPVSSPVESGRSITRTDLEHVIRRAAELSIADSDAAERLTEQDLVRIGDDLGLPARHVWQALYERPSLSARKLVGGEYFGSPIVVASRIVPGDVALTRRRLEDYLLTREYLTVVRRTAEELRLLPAEDTISAVARLFSRPRSRHHLAHARRVIVAAHPLPSGEGVVRIEMDLEEARRKERNEALGWGTMVGAIGFGAGMGAVEMVAPGASGTIGGIAAGVALAIPSAYATFVGIGRRFRRKTAEAKLELEGLLDRLESGERLEPPPAPWRRRLGLRLFGHR